MALSENDQDEFYSQTSPMPSSAGVKAPNFHPMHATANGKHVPRHTTTTTNLPKTARAPAMTTIDNSSASRQLSTSVSWPIGLAIVPTLGSFVIGSPDVWSDFVMIVLILYYVYKWMTVPWSYYESARSRRVIVLQGTPSLSQERKHPRPGESERREKIAEELRRHELAGLVWVIVSPLVAGYTLQYSRYFLSNYERYMSSFNVMVFVLAASLKPIAHVMRLLRERTLHLQNEILVSETQLQALQKKLDLLEDELHTLRNAFATKKEIVLIKDEMNPAVHQLAQTLRRFEKEDAALRTRAEERFSTIEQKVTEFNQFISYRIEQEQRQSTHGMIVSLILLPLNIGLWIAKSMTDFIPVPRAILGSSATVAAATSTFHRRSATLHMPSSKHLTHPGMQADNHSHPRDATLNIPRHSKSKTAGGTSSHRSRHATS